jgi:predicted permease
VVSASAAHVLPISRNLWTRGIQVEGYTFRPDENETVGFNVIAPNYFIAIGTPLLQGREFDSRDTAVSPKVAVVNQAFARYFFGDASPVGRRVTSVDVTYEIVGVVRDAKYTNLRAGIMKTMYICWQQRSGEQPGNYTYIARVAGGNPLSLAPMLDRLVQETDPGLRAQPPRTYATLIDQSIVTERILATLGGFFGALALIVACLGIFGVMAFQVSRRINELGVRMALGASRGHIVRLVLREVALMLTAGTVIGCGAALMLTGLTSKLLYGLTSTDPVVFVLSAAVLCAAALAAAWLPARRASRVDPMAALRHE